MKKTEPIVVFITAPADEAENLAARLLEKRRAACVNIIPAVESRFWWEGKIDSSQESLLIVKTQADKLAGITKLVKGVHSYTVPEIIALPIIGGNPDYLDWIDREVA
jgi:periplasmic divalent cation tolerance protein